MKCAYVDSVSPKCEGPVVFTTHDGRGCVDVCLAHAVWRAHCSISFGHGSNCKHPEKK